MAADSWPWFSLDRGTDSPVPTAGRIGALVVSIIMMCGIGAAPAAEPPERPAEAAPRTLPGTGFHRMELALEEGASLRYSVFVPRKSGDHPAPLVLALHYGGQVVPYYGESFLKLLVKPAFDGLPAVLVAPDCPARGWTEAVSERAVLELLDHAVSIWPVDPDRVVVTGYSMGAIGAWFLAERHPGRFAAAIPVAGRPAEVAKMRVPVYAIHGRRDEIIAWEPTRRAVEALRARGVSAEFVLVDGPTHYQTARFIRPLAGATHWLQELWKVEQSSFDSTPNLAQDPL